VSPPKYTFLKEGEGEKEEGRRRGKK